MKKNILILFIIIIQILTFSNSDKRLNPIFSVEAGFYENPFYLELYCENKNAKIYYTLDGSEPIPGFKNTYLYTKPIYIADRTNEKNNYSMIKTSVFWNPPKGLVYKGTVIRAKAFLGNIYSKTISKSYFIGPKNKYSFMVVSIITDPNNLFDYERGIYIPGKKFDEDDENTEEFKGNFHENGKEWEREAHIEFIENGELKYEDDVGIRIHGGFTATLPLKSLRIYARDKYGKKKINYEIFPGLNDINGNIINKFDKLILRNGGNDFQDTIFRDALVHTLVKDLNFDTMAFRPAIHFINGEYWGIVNIRERYDTDYLKEHYGVKDAVILEVTDDPESKTHIAVDEGKNGDEKPFLELKRFIVDYNMAIPQNYEYVKKRIDIDNYIKYLVTEMFIDNRDWPGNNIRIWRTTKDFSNEYGHDGKWRYMLFDTDNSLYLYDYDTIKHAIDGDPNVIFPNPIWSTEMLKNLLDNEEFKIQFINTFMDLLNTTFSLDNTLPLVDYFINLYKNEMSEHINRWNFPESYEYWLDGAEYMKTFFEERSKYIIKYLREYFNLNSTKEIIVESTVGGGISINSIKIDNIEKKKNMTYFTGIPITFSPYPKENYSFSHWEIDGKIYENKILIIKPESFNNIKAVYKKIY
ncbi:CotH kinase family protein [Marinitoga litoralis]|uniref:CotH kinase family protein n=1 Tax=Marinitoga litoralis TaxID=570855 RepID=UPI00196096AD|nr:CotH kinase family protein [Marinitoga litoralis]MBM7560188.1 hypothetical protein [Marinitoga litoralis]